MSASTLVTDTPTPASTLAALSSAQFDVLKQITAYYRTVRILRSTGWINLLLGGVTLWAGLSVPAYYRNSFSNIQSVIGFLIVAQSFWALTRPSLKGVLGLAIVLLISGTWNLFLTIYGRFSGPELWIGAFGLYQVWGAYRTARLYVRSTEKSLQKPSLETAHDYEALRQSILHPLPGFAPELLKVQFSRNRHWWSGLLVPNRIVLAHPRSSELLIADQSTFAIVADNPKSASRDSLGILAQIGEDILIGKIYPGSLQQYLRWKGIEDAEAGLTPTLKHNRRLRKILWWTMLVLLVLIGLFIASMIIFASRYS